MRAHIYYLSLCELQRWVHPWRSIQRKEPWGGTGAPATSPSSLPPPHGIIDKAGSQGGHGKARMLGHPESMATAWAGGALGPS